MKTVDVDVAIVGSGAGGGTVAQALGALARDGARVVVFEAGSRFRPQDFTGHELEMSRRLYAESGGFLTRDLSMTLAFAEAYGGSTVVYTGTSLPVQPGTVERWAVPGLDYPDLAARCRRYLRENGARLLTESELNESNRLFRDACRKLGYAVEQFPVNVRDCAGRGLCNLGCDRGAKQGTNRVQLPAAERDGVRVVTDARVERIGDQWLDVAIEPRAWGAQPPWPAGHYRVTARTIVVAAGAIGSPALLARSRLPVQLPALGRYFTCHPALIMVGQHEHGLAGYPGHPKSFYSDHFAASQRFLLETCMYFPFVTAKSLSGFGAEHESMLERMDRLQMVLALALDEPDPENRVSVDNRGNPVVDYRLTPEVLDSLHEASLASARILFASGARRVHVPSAKAFSIDRDELNRLGELVPRAGMRPGRVPIAAAHLMGGCRMGRGPGDSVTDSWGQVHGLPWLHVADASLFPACARINPYITVMALADRVAEAVLARATSARAA